MFHVFSVHSHLVSSFVFSSSRNTGHFGIIRYMRTPRQVRRGAVYFIIYAVICHLCFVFGNAPAFLPHVFVRRQEMDYLTAEDLYYFALFFFNIRIKIVFGILAGSLLFTEGSGPSGRTVRRCREVFYEIFDYRSGRHRRCAWL